MATRLALLFFRTFDNSIGPFTVQQALYPANTKRVLHYFQRRITKNYVDLCYFSVLSW